MFDIFFKDIFIYVKLARIKDLHTKEFQYRKYIFIGYNKRILLF